MRGGVRRRGAARRPCAAPTHGWLAGARACARSRRRMASSLRATGAAWAWSRRVRWRATAGATRSYCSRPHACAALTAIGGRGSAALDQGPVAEATERGHHVSVIPLLSLVVGVTPMLFTIFSGASLTRSCRARRRRPMRRACQRDRTPRPPVTTPGSVASVSGFADTGSATGWPCRARQRGDAHPPLQVTVLPRQDRISFRIPGARGSG
jgi:hypothetical protein